MGYKNFLDECEYVISKDNLTYEEAKKRVRDNWIANKRYDDLFVFLLDNYNGLFSDFSYPFVKALLENNKINMYKNYWKSCLQSSVKNFWSYSEFYNKNFHNKYKRGLFNFFQQQEKCINEKKITTEELLIVDKNLVEKNSKNVPSKQDFKLNLIWKWYKTQEFIDVFIDAMKKIDAQDEIERAKIIKESIYNLQKPKAKPTTDKRKIDETLFWKLIKETREESQNNGDFLELLQEKLEAMSAAEIKKFKKHLLEKMNELDHWDIWALAYIVRKGCGDDAFDYFKAWVVSKGEEVFEQVKTLQIKKLKEIFNQEDPQFEEFMYVAQEAYENKKSEEMPTPRIKSIPIQGKEWEEEKLRERYPDLCEAFGY